MDVSQPRKLPAKEEVLQWFKDTGSTPQAGEEGKKGDCCCLIPCLFDLAGSPEWLLDESNEIKWSELGNLYEIDYTMLTMGFDGGLRGCPFESDLDDEECWKIGKYLRDNFRK